MQMIRFRVQNFKKVKDTGWIDCSRLTVLVGKNEAGKSATFRGLSKLNPSDGEKYDGLKEFPRKRYASEFKQKDWPVVSAVFELSENERKQISTSFPALKDVRTVLCTKSYSGKIAVGFEPEADSQNISNAGFRLILESSVAKIQEAASPEGKGDQLQAIKNALLPQLSSKLQSLSSAPATDSVQGSLVTEIINLLSTQANEDWQKAILKSAIDDVKEFQKKLERGSQLSGARQWVVEHLPRFVYFDRYDVIDSAIHIPTFLQQLKQNPTAPRVRATKALFQHVGLDLQAIEQLDPNQPNKSVDELRRMVDQRAILMSSASAEMTKRFSEWWEQRKHKFRYQVDGPFFRVWVSDDLDPSEIELDQRSAGMQYFFSFYLVFLVEAADAHRNSILLLDEAGLQLHGTAQEKIVKFLEKLSEENQLLYTTHSPFMIDGDHLENVRVVYEDKEDGTSKVSSNVWPDDRDSLFPLQAGLGYALAQTLFYSKRQLVVEGLTDYWILKSMDGILKEKSTGLREDIVIVPAGGTKNLMPLASMLHGHDIKLAVLLDGDQPGLRKGKELKEKLLIGCLFVSTYTEVDEAELEDLFPKEYYLEAVKQAYPKFHPKFTSEEDEIKCITKRVGAAFRRTSSEEFEKWRPVRVILEWLTGENRNNRSIPHQTLELFQRIFDDVNSILQ